MQLSRLRHAAHGAGATVNDLVLAAVCGALRARLADAHEPIADVRAIMPVDLRDPTEPLPRDLGNKFGLLYVSMPVSVIEPLARLSEVSRRTIAAKRSPSAGISFSILDAVGRTPAAVEQLLVGPFAAKGSAVMTNVVGPREPVFLAGRRLRGTVGWPPESGGLGLGVSIISYDSELTVGVLTDDHLFPDPHGLLADVTRELDLILEAIRTLPSGDAQDPVAERVAEPHSS